MSEPKDADIGVTGLAVMGRNLARNFARHGHVVALHNRSPARTRSLVAEHGDEGTFSLCTFLYVDALARAGRLDDAVLTFEKMQTYGNHLGLYSEEIGSTGEQLGNFPQAFTHLSLINAAITLNHQLDLREGKAEPALSGTG